MGQSQKLETQFVRRGFGKDNDAVVNTGIGEFAEGIAKWGGNDVCGFDVGREGGERRIGGGRGASKSGAELTSTLLRSWAFGLGVTVAERSSDWAGLGGMRYGSLDSASAILLSLPG